ncbi:MAG: hypothetical protein PHO62_06075 [Sulfurimonas sp.]|uniref:hypothetical protein n=1 Tax=Sulfurimonas sp. TaxID=2022749 RepID=UPI0026205A48|nr:hypothetical protein [Sulfurimonas sp.]MDD5372975.1 hypothetical protein [Sulfurimonas sp.]
MSRVFLFFLFCVSILNADFLQPNSYVARLNEYKYVTPNDIAVKIPKDVKLVIVSSQKATGALVNEYLDSQSPDYLQKNRAVFIADINKMPTIVTKMFALPKLRKYKHPIYISNDERFEEVVPSKDDRVTLLYVENSIIKNISYISTKEELKKAIEK